MKVLVTGTTGFVGGAVARALVKAGVEVRVLSRKGADLQNLAGLPSNRSMGTCVIAIRCGQRPAAAVGSSTMSRRITRCGPRIPPSFTISTSPAPNSARNAREAGIERTVYCSTIGAIGLPPGGGLGTEETPVSLDQMAGHYKRSKYLAEQEVLKLAREGLPVVIVNPSAPVGEADVKPTPTGQIIVDFMKGRMPAYIETGMNLIDVEDVAQGHLLAMQKGLLGERYILGNKNLYVK